MKIRLYFVGLFAALSIVSASAQDAAKDMAKCYTTWDESYFYIAVKVDNPNIIATHTKPNEDIGSDDSVAVYIDSTGKRPDKITPNCFSMQASPAGGCCFLAGTKDGKLEKKAVWSFKYGVNVQGTINNPDDIDMGYTVELAIPWDVLNASRPTSGDMIALNVVVRRGGSSVSLSPNVKTDDDMLLPAKWSKIVFAPYSFAAATTNVEKIISAKYISRAPLVNGVVSDKEWHESTSFVINLPTPAGVVYEAKFPVQKTVMTPYFYWWQEDKRKAEPFTQLTRNGKSILTDSPAKNIGPWFSYDRAQWHKEELSDMVAAGIDVALPYYVDTKANYSQKGLMCLVTALQELDAEGKAYPTLGMYLRVPDASGSKEDRWNAAYNLISDFFSRVPSQYRALAQAGKPRNGQLGNLVFAYSPSGIISPEFTEYCSAKFEKDFGCPLVFIADSSSADGLDGVVKSKRGGAKFSDAGRISIAYINPGYDDGELAAAERAMVSRFGGTNYEKNWADMLAGKPSWVICGSWNELMGGTDICATREYGRKYIDATASNAKTFKGNLDYDAQYLSCSIPKVIPGKQFATAVLEIKNAGNAPWRVSEGYAVAYRWYRNGRFFGESKIRRPLDRDVMPGGRITVDVGIATVDTKGAAMPDGPCEARIELMRLSDGKWFTTMGDQPLVVPITVGAVPEWSAAWVVGKVPAMMATGQSYDAALRVRNDGSMTWLKGVTKLGCKLFKVSGGSAEEVKIKDCNVILAKDCKPGGIAEFNADLALIGADKKPIPSCKQGDRWSYQLRFDLYNGQKWLSETGSSTLKRTVAVLDKDYGPRIVDCNIAAKLTAGQSVDVKVVVRNMGTQLWDKKRVKLGYHWYHLDGAEMLWDGITTPIPSNMQPGFSSVMTTKVKAPEYDGQYVLVWDMMIDGVWQSTQPLSRGGDILPVSIQVTGGKLVFADLVSLYDTTAASPDTDRTVGDFDSAGSSFPSEVIPPDVSENNEASRVYPSGYRLDRQDQADGRISFYYPDSISGSKSAISCKGQKITVSQGSYRMLHILGASTNSATSGELTLNYSNTDQPATLQMSDWTSAPTHGEKIALQASHRHTKDGDDLTKTCRLYDYAIPVDSSKQLTGITLPQNADMKIVAVTLEK